MSANTTSTASRRTHWIFGRMPQAAARVARHAPAPAVYRAPASRSGAMAVLPLEQVAPDTADASAAGAQGDR